MEIKCKNGTNHKKEIWHYIDKAGICRFWSGKILTICQNSEIALKQDQLYKATDVLTLTIWTLNILDLCRELSDIQGWHL